MFLLWVHTLIMFHFYFCEAVTPATHTHPSTITMTTFHLLSPTLAALRSVSVTALFSCLPAERSVCLLATLPLPHYSHKDLCMCVRVRVSWLNGCVLRPAGLEQNQEDILYDDMVRRRDLDWNHSRETETVHIRSYQVIMIMSSTCPVMIMQLRSSQD